MKLNPPLLALAAGAFGIGVTEFAPMGLLPVIATDLGVSIPTAGLLISAYALGVMLGAPLMTLTTGRVPRRTLLIGLAATLGFVTAMLVTYGLGLTLGNWLGGKFADKSVDRTLIVTLASLSAILVAFAFAMPFAVPTSILVFLWGIASFALVPPLQVRVMAAAGDAPNLASAMNIGAFNLGNAIGAAVGGAVIAGGLGYPAVSMAGAAASGLGLLLVLFLTRKRSPVTVPAIG
ncbi:MFS transporter [Brevundimonas sp.]|uniref:MFS transporter n=1 Tax=Brevundimonas sp. TaxID=1871086 RepID=UPI003568027E